MLDPCDFHVNVAAAAPLPSLQALSEAAERDLADMHAAQMDARSARQASTVEGMQQQLTHLATMLSAVQAKLDERKRPGVEALMDAYRGLSNPQVMIEFEVPGSGWLQKEGEVLHKVPIYGGAFEVQLRCLGVGAAEANGMWVPFLKSKVAVARVHEERAAQLLTLLPQAQVQLIQFSLMPMYRDAATGKVLHRERATMSCGRSDPDNYIAKLTRAAGGNGGICVLILNRALAHMSESPPYVGASMAKAVEALEVALRAHTFLVMGELKLSA